jgi:uncharacterized protein (TIGR02271 family)
MDRHDDRDLDRDRDLASPDDYDSTAAEGEHHATTGGSAAAGAVTGGVIGLAGGPVGAAIGAIGGAIVGAAAERMMHSDDDAERARAGLDNDHDSDPLIEDRAKGETRTGSGATGAYDTTSDPRAAAWDAGRPSADTDAATATTGAAWQGTGATGDIDTTSTTRGEAWDRSSTASEGAGDRLHLREEQLQARTTPVETGEVTIGKEVVEERRTVDVPVTREEVYVERRPVDRQASDHPIDASDRTIEVPVREERVEVEKTPVVYEEVGVAKREVTETQQVNETVRREEARIEREGEVNLRDQATGTSDRTTDRKI